jgi:iron complex transport system ATP-binding protein
MSGLVAHGLSVVIKDRAILDRADLAVARGELVGLIGPNGAGKTTALRAVLGLVEASAARIEIDGRDIRALPPRERAKLIAYLPQARDVHWPVSGHTLVALGRHPHGDAASPRGEAAIAKALGQSDATQFAARDVRTLSGGELARVLLARALAVEAPILAADEPVAALDPGHQLAAMENLKQIARLSAVLVVMHDLGLAARFCDRIYLLHAGRVLAAGPAREVIASPALETAFGIRLVHAEADGIPLIAPIGA